MPQGDAGRSLEEMTARQIDEAAVRLREFGPRAVSDLVLACVVFALAITASRTHPPLALPLLIGAMAVTFLGCVRSCAVRSWSRISPVSRRRM